MRRTICAGAFASLLLLAGCTVGPNYKRPVVNVPATYRATNDANATDNHATASLGDEKWWTVFQDEQLQQLIRTALKQNYDVRIAATRILQAEQQVTITRSNEFPNVSGGPSVSGVRQPGIPKVFSAYSYLADQIGLSANWTVDFWGRYRRATEAARANLRATEWGQRAIVSTLVANVATAYFGLREYDLELEIAERTLASRRQSLTLTQTLEQGGATSLVDVRQAEQLVEEAAESIPDLQRAIAQAENQLSILLGENPTEIARGRALTEQPLPETIPAGLPSRLLERRPDIQQAEQQLIAANAQIGVARAQLFPEISLTGTAGLQSIGLGDLFTWPSRSWNWTASLSQPIFNAGALRANVRLSQAQQQQALLTYEQTIQQAFREVSDSLIAYAKYRQFREHQERLTTAARGASDLSHTRYQGGVTSYLEVLTSETNYFAAELNLARARLNERLALVQVYNSLGGGWEQ
ncbi:MAG TPA: efflux transporter outer membrane subunit [Bryobacteraceae bacterium]|jgi:multidrug efflux system outer membrane protein|nr:efflux transporter outer membrane subunit [Bryobacteraceae bacterium]